MAKRFRRVLRRKRKRANENEEEALQAEEQPLEAPPSEEPPKINVEPSPEEYEALHEELLTLDEPPNNGVDPEPQWLFRHFDEHPPACKVVVDIGANGSYRSNSWHLIARRGWRGVLAEAAEESAARCRRQFLGDFVVEHVAVSDSPGVASFYIATKDGHSSLHRNWPSAKFVSSQQVQVVTLPQLLERHNVPTNFGLLSVDTEGNDPKVIIPMLKDQRWRPRIVVHEIPPRGWRDSLLAECLQVAGYELAASLGHNKIWRRRDDAR